MKRNIDEILKHYLVALLWTEEEELGTFSIEDIDSEPTNNANMNSLELCRLVVESFVALALPLLTEEWTDEQIGHDLWLTRCGHGAGFWDRDLPNGDELTEISQLFRFSGEVYEENGVVFVHEQPVELDLVFREYERLPQNVQDILIKFEEGEFSYDVCQNLVDELEAVDYTCDYYLDAEPYHLRYKGEA